MKRYDVLVVGGGIAGVSVGYEVSKNRTVGVLDMESQLAYHTSGRSMATFLESYGGPTIRALTTGSRSFFEHPIAEMGEQLLSPLGLLWLGPEGEVEGLRGLYEEVRPLVPDVRMIDADEVMELNPVLKEGYAQIGMYEPDATEIDVHALHQGYVKGLKDHGGETIVSAKVVQAERVGDVWRVTDANGEVYEAETIINAAGAWVDQVGDLFGADPIGIQPCRRSAFIVKPPEGISARGVPLTSALSNTWYFMPQGDAFACSPAEENLLEPCDVKADELEIARAIEEMNECTKLNIRSVGHTWAGLRSFVADHVPVAGFDPKVDGLFWYAGQGGYGMQTAPALSQTAAALLSGDEIPQDLINRGLDVANLAVDRPSLKPGAAH